MERLQAAVESEDGFALAEKDLTLRGPGALYGTEQSGFFALRFARISDTVLIQKTRRMAQEMITEDATLSHLPFLRERLGAQ